MYPWGHVGIAYLLYSLYAHGRSRRPPRSTPAVAVLFGSQFADLIDKPFWAVGVFPTGRDLMHSLFIVAVLIAVVYVAAIALGHVETATAFILAHLSHLAADLPLRLFLGYPFGTEFLLWPVLPHNTFGYSERLFESPAFVSQVTTSLTDPSTFIALEVTLLVLAVTLWVVDGCPGLEYVRGRFDRS